MLLHQRHQDRPLVVYLTYAESKALFHGFYSTTRSALSELRPQKARPAITASLSPSLSLHRPQRVLPAHDAKRPLLKLTHPLPAHLDLPLSIHIERYMGRPSPSPSSVAVLATAGAGAYERRCPSSPDDDDDDYYEDDDFEFTPLLLRPRRRRGARAERPRRTAHHAAAATQPPPPQHRARRGGTPISIAAAAAAATPASRKVRWHDMAFGSVRVPAAMDTGEIRRRLHARRHAVAASGAGNEPSSATAAAAAGWAPWRLIRSLSCKGVEAVAVAAAAAPVRLV